MENLQQVTTKQIAYWSDGYFIADDDALEQAELLDSIDAFGSEHRVIEIPANANHEQIEELVNQELM